MRLLSGDFFSGRVVSTRSHKRQARTDARVMVTGQAGRRYILWLPQRWRLTAQYHPGGLHEILLFSSMHRYANRSLTFAFLNDERVIKWNRALIDEGLLFGD
jgi:hypothetical protein